MTPPERRRSSDQNQISITETQKSPQVLDEHLRSSEDTSRPLLGSEQDGKEFKQAEESAPKAVQRTPSRGSIWEWARVGTGRLSIIGRLPHPEWKGPASSKAMSDLTTNGMPENETILESLDDFSIPSMTKTEPYNEERQLEAAAAKLEGLGVVTASSIMSPFFSQTKRSSDELVAASSTASTPAALALKTEDWSYGETSTPSAASKDSPPSTPDTPTPQQRRRDTPVESDATPTKDAPKKVAPKSSKSSVYEAVTNGNGNSNGTPAKLRSASKDTPSPQRIPMYKIALASHLLSPARSTAST